MRELTYKVPFRRLAKLSRSIGRKAYSGIWWARWLLLVFFFAVLFALSAFEDSLAGILVPFGISYSVNVLLIATILLVLAGMFLIRKYQRRQVKDRVDFDQSIRLVQDENGIRIATDQIEYFVKWPGISQVLIERDGVVLSHGNLFWLVPDTAFASPAERLGFIRDVYDRLEEKARAASERHVRPMLEAGGRSQF
jgi:hypothetical protein